MRITGLATGLDMDKIITDSMKPYRIKIDQMGQKKDIVEIKQKLYRDVIKDSREFYDNYFTTGKSDSLLLSSNWKSVSFTSGDENVVSAKASASAIKDNYTVSVGQLATKATTVLNESSITVGKNITVDGVKIENITDEEVKDPKILVDRIKKSLSENKKDIAVKYSEISGGIIFESKETGAKQNAIKVESDGVEISGALAGKDLIAYISNSNGTSKKYENSNNSITTDGITFTFNSVNCELDVDGKIKPDTGNPIRITGKTDTKEIKEKLIGFVNDYNKLIGKLNTLTATKHDRGYDPLTAEQKKEMSESEIKLWNERVEKGQLYRDSDITRIADNMKSTMRSLMGDSGLKLEKIGIKPLKDYSGTKNGTFTIDEDALTKALEENPEGVMNLFISNPDSKDPNQTGIMQKLKGTLDKEFMRSDSPLLKKAGFEGTSTFSTNDLTKNMSNYEKKIKDMEKSFSRREQQLYSKYATLETMMNKLNSQQSNLMSQLGMS